MNRGKFYLTVVIFSLTGQIAWVVENMYFNVFIYNVFSASAAQISLMVSLSSAAATVTTLLVGAFADKVGKRKIFITLGYILWGVSVMVFALLRKDVIGKFVPAARVTAVGVALVIIMDCVMTFFGSAANDACFNAYLTDNTDSTNRGRTEGINSMMPLVAILVVFGGFMAFDLTKESSWTAIFLIIGVLVVIIGVSGVFLIKEKPIDASGNKSYFKNIIYGFRPSVIKSSPELYLSLACYAVFGIAIQIFMPYLILYYSVSLGLDNYVVIMAPAIICAAAFTFFYGRLYDKSGFGKTIFTPVAIMTAGFLILFFFKQTPLVFIGSLFMMCGYLAGTGIFGAVVRDYTPESKTGMFQGLRIFAQVLIPGLIGPTIGAFVLRNADKITNSDGTQSFVPNEKIFIAAAIVCVALALLLVPVTLFIKKRKLSAKTEETA